MSRKAWAFVLLVMSVGALLTVVASAAPSDVPSDWVALGVLTLLATVGQIWIARAPGHQSYHPAILFFFAAMLTLPPGLYIVVVAVPHLLEWVRERVIRSQRLRNWYLQPFNIANHVIAGTGARVLISVLAPEGFGSQTPLSAAIVLLGAATYVVLNHALTGQAIVLARGVPWRETGILRVENLITDLIMLLLGQVFAFLYGVNKVLILPAISPLILIYRALLVPQLRRDAQTDGKTGLLNAKYFVELFEDELERAERFGRPLSVIMADLDLLRNVNNTYGHLAGDTVLGRLGSIIRASVRKYDLAARFGGEEFVIALPEVGASGATAFAERLRQAVEQTDIDVDTSPTPIRVTISLGVASFPSDARDATELVHEADVAVYQAKLTGRNCVVHASDVPHAAKLETLAAAERIAHPYESSYAPIPRMTRKTPEVVEEPAPRERAAAQTTHPETKLAGAKGGPGEPPAPAQPLRKRVLLAVVIATVIAAGAGLAVWGFSAAAKIDLLAIGVFAGLAVLAELLQTDMYGASTVSVAVAVNFAAAVVGGIPAVVAVSWVITAIHYIRRRPEFYKALFNWAMHILAGSAPVLIFRAFGMPIAASNALSLVVPAVPSALAYYVLESGPITVVVSLSRGLRIGDTFREYYRWLISHYLVLGLMGLFMSLAYSALGIIGVLIFVAPVIMMRYTQSQYVDKTQHSVEELRRMNLELSRANEEIRAANAATRNLNEELFLTMAKINDARDPFVAGHSAKVADYATALAAEMGLPADRIELVRQAAFLHDIGKIAIAEQVLQKPGPLTPSEYEYLKNHAALGADFLETCQGLRHLTQIVRHHHERWDGHGYPDGLPEQEVPLEARILSVCDAVEAMASDRPYRQAWTVDFIVSELERSAGTQFDPDIVRAFIRLLKRRGPELIVNSAKEIQQRVAGDQGVEPGNSWYGRLATQDDTSLWN